LRYRRQNTEQWWSFDTTHVGLGDVTLVGPDEMKSVDDVGAFFMYTMGGDLSDDLPQAKGKQGAKIRIGMALSQVRSPPRTSRFASTIHWEAMYLVWYQA
jgi:hypothetical protein